jgi:hypothetical protein
VRTPYRIATTLVALAAVFPFGMGAAAAETADPVVVQAAWYWADQTVIVGPEVLHPPAQLTGVPAKNLAVAYKGEENGAPDKVSYLAWDVSMIPAGSTVSRFEFTIAVESDPAVTQATPPDYKLVACGAIGDFAPAEAGSFADKPADDCSSVAPGVYDATKKTWTFDVAPYADLWAKGDPPSGIGILPDPKSEVPFQVVLEPADTVKTSVEFTPPAPVAVPTTEPDVNPILPPAQQPTYYAAPPAVPNTAPVPVAQPAPTPAPPVVAISEPRQVAPVARGITFPSKSGLPAAFWGGALAAIALLGSASLMLGDATVPVEAPRGRTVTRSLR